RRRGQCACPLIFVLNVGTKTKNTILQILSSGGILSKEQVADILAKEDVSRLKILKARESKGTTTRYGMQRQSDVSIVDIIEFMNLEIPNNGNTHITEDIIMKEIAKYLKIPFLKIDPLKLDADIVTKIISRPFAIKHQVVPISISGNTLKLATSNPFDYEGIDRIKQSKGYDIDLVLSIRSDVMKIVTEFYGFKSSIDAAQNEMSSEIDLGNLEQYVKLKSITELAATDQHISNAVEYLLHYAYSQRASDIHIEPKREHCLVRFRIDGVLHNIHKMPKAVYPAFASRIKTLARMDIAEKRRPQDGRIKTMQDGQEIELRVSTLPVAFGEKIVIRIFDPGVLMQNIDELGFSPRESNLFRSFISAPYGLILVTGPTGSGKTTTLYSALKALATPDVNLTTIEDPIEMICEEVNQTSIQPQVDITFASSLRTILRQDPDIIMVGEIRDAETANIATQAALTGHLMLSSIHASDSVGVLLRLLDLGVESFLVASSVIGVVAQRMVRRICPDCSHLIEAPVVEQMAYEKEIGEKQTKFLYGTGCKSCAYTGYLGRIGIFEILTMSDTIRRMVAKQAVISDIRVQALKEGMTSMMNDGMRKVKAGVTTPAEVLRSAYSSD
ncbi:MAG: type II/IV secretion system protein, partial [Dehalococcoidales bacterium]|nr:type II/IV secretion system protein [Dehalococcoidales bacterium]